MNDLIHRSHVCTRTMRQLLLLVAAIVFVVGCEQPKPHVAEPFSVPDQFSDSRGTWDRIEGETSSADNQLIGKFFKKHASLVGSPEWTGQPEKFVCRENKARKRFYWFSGNAENPSWNAIEVNGTQVKQFSGVGAPGTETQD